MTPTPPPKTYKARDIEAALTKKGFERRESHHVILSLVVEGKVTAIKTRIGHGQTEYTDTLLALVRKQLGRLSPQQFRDLVDCPLEYSAYVKILRDNRRIP